MRTGTPQLCHNCVFQSKPVTPLHCNGGGGQRGWASKHYSTDPKLLHDCSQTTAEEARSPNANDQDGFVFHLTRRDFSECHEMFLKREDVSRREGTPTAKQRINLLTWDQLLFSFSFLFFYIVVAPMFSVYYCLSRLRRINPTQTQLERLHHRKMSSHSFFFFFFLHLWMFFKEFRFNF